MSKSKAKGIAVLFAFALAFVLAAFLSMSFPMAEVHAAEHEVSDSNELMGALESAEEGDTIRLTQDITLDMGNQYLEAAVSFTVDLNGKTLTLTTTNVNFCVRVPEGVTIAIVDGTEADGSVKVTSGGSFISSSEGSTLILRDISVDFTTTSTYPTIVPAINVGGSFIRDNVAFKTAVDSTNPSTKVEEMKNPSTTGGVATYVVNGEDDLAAAIADEDYAIMEIAADLEISLDADLEKNIVVAAENTVTIDLNGHRLTSDTTGVATIWNKGKLELKSSVEGGSVTRETWKNYYVIRNNGEMTINGENLTVYNDNAKDSSSLIDNNILNSADENDPSIVNRQAVLTINGGTYRSAFSNAVKNDPDGTLVINAGDFTANSAKQGAVFTYDDTTINGGSFTSGSGHAVYAAYATGNSHTVKIQNGEFYGEVFASSGSDIIVYNGNFDRAVSAQYIAPDSALYVSEEGDGMLAVASEPPAGMTKAVAYVGDNAYTTLQEAISANGTEVNLVSDVEESVTVPSGVDTRFRMNGFTLTAASDNAPGITVEGALNWVNEVTGTISGKVGVLVKDGGSIIIDDEPVITFAGETNLSVEAGGEATIANGIFEGAIVNNGGSIELTGGTYANAPESDWLATGYDVLANEDGTYRVARLVAQMVYTQDGQTITEGFSSWDDLLAKLSGLTDDITITLYNTVVDGSAALEIAAGQNVTLNTNSKTSFANIINSGTLTIQGTTSGYTYGTVTNRAGGKLTVEGGVFRGVFADENEQPGIVIAGRSFYWDAEGAVMRSVLPFIADGYCFTRLTSAGYATVDEGEALVKVTDGDYELYFSALDLANTYASYLTVNEEVVLEIIEDITFNYNYLTFGSTASAAAAKSWIIDLGGNTISFNSTNGRAIELGRSNYPITFTVTGGTLRVAGVSASNNMFNVRYGSTLNLEDVDIVCADEGTAPKAMIGLLDAGSTLNIAGGNYYGGIAAETDTSVSIKEGSSFGADVTKFLDDGLTQNENGTVIKNGEDNAVAMVISSNGDTAYYTALKDAFLKAPSGSTIEILKDVTQTTEADLAYGYVSGQGGAWMFLHDKSVTINGNGHTLTMTTAAWGLYIIDTDDVSETIVVNDLTIVSTTPVLQEGNIKFSAALVIYNGYVDLTLNNVVLNTANTGVRNASPLLNVGIESKDTNITLNDSTLAANMANGYAFLTQVVVDLTIRDSELSGWSALYIQGEASGSTIEIIDSEIVTDSNHTGGDNYFGTIVLNAPNITVNVIGGSISASAEGSYQSVVFYSPNFGASLTGSAVTFTDTDISIEGDARFAGEVIPADRDIEVAGGTFNFLVEEEFLAEGYAPLAQGDGTYAVVDEEEAASAGDAVAAIETESGRILYATLAEAIANAENGATIVLIANVEVASPSNGSGIAINDKNLTIDFNGCKIIDRGTGSALTVGGTSVVTLIDSGEAGGVAGGSGGNNVAVTALGNAVVNIEGGVYSVGPDASGLGNSTIYISSADAQVNISGGTFSSEAMYNGKYYVLNQNNSAAGNYTVTGGTFVNFNPIIGDDYLGGTFIDPEAAVALDEDGNFTVYADPSDVPAEAEAVYAFENGAAVAVVKTEDALIDAFAGEYEVIRLGASFTLDEQIRICRDVTLDLSDYTLSIGSEGLERADMVVLATYTEDGSAGLLTIKGNAKGTIDASNADDLTVPVGAMGAGSKVIIESGTIIVDTELESCVFVNTDAKVEITGGTFINRAAKYSRGDDNGPALTVNVRAGAPDAGELLVINGGTFVGRNPAMGDDSVSGSFLADNVVLGRASDGSFTVYESAEAAVSAGANAVYTVDESGAALAVVYDEASLSEALSYGYETVRLGADIKVTGELTVPDGRELTLDLAGKTLQKTTSGHFITNSGTLTITDSTVSSEDDQAYGGKIEHTFPTGGYTIRNYGDLTLEKITVQNNTASTSSLIANNAAKSNGSYEQANPAVLTINSGYYLSCGANAVKNDEYGRLFINGGLFVSEDATKTVSGDHEFVSQAVQNWAYAEITGGTFEGVYVGLSANAYGGQTNTTLIKGGTFRATDAETGRGLQLTQGDSSNDTPGVINVTVSGGTFESPVEYGAVDTAVFSSEDSFTVTEGSTAVFEDDVLLPMEMNISIADGEYHGTVDAGEKEGYITGGDFAVLPDSTAFAEGFAAADPDGDGIYTTVDESDYIVSMTVNGKRVVYETLADAVAAAPTDGTEAIIEFIGAETEYRGSGVVVNAGQNIVIDFNGKTYIVIDPTVGSSGTETNGFQLLKGATVVMQDGTLKAETTEAQILIQKYCDLTLKNMTLDARGSNVKYVVSNNNGKTVFSGNTNIYAAENNCAFDVYYWPQGGNGYTGGAQVVFDSTFNGTVVGNVEYTRDTSGYDPEGGWQSVSTLTFEQGNEGTFDIEFTDIDGTVEAAGIEIAGGSFTNPVDYRLFKEGFAAEWNEEDGAYVVDEGEYIVTATVEGVEVGFTSLQDAIDACGTDEATITLLKDVQGSITIGAGQNITLNLNGKTLTNSGNAHTIYNSGRLTVNGDGTVDNINHAHSALVNYGTAVLNGGLFTRSQEDGTSGSNSWYVIINQGTMTVNAGVRVYTAQEVSTFTSLFVNGLENGAYPLPVGEDNAHLTVNGGSFMGGVAAIKNDYYGIVEINGGTFGCTGTGVALQNWGEASISGDKTVFEQNLEAYTWVDQYTRGTTIISGGTFRGKVVAREYTPDPNDEDPIVYDKKNVSITGGTFAESVPTAYMGEGFSLTRNEDGTFGIANTEAFASVTRGEVEYRFATFTDAFAFAEASDTVTLLANVELAETLTIDKAITLDLNDNTITNNGAGAAIYISASDVTVCNGTILSESGNGINIWAADPATTELTGVVVEDVNITANGSGSAGRAFQIQNANVRIANADITASVSGVLAVLGSDVTLEKTNITYTGSGNAVEADCSDVTLREVTLTSSGYGVAFFGAYYRDEAVGNEDSFNKLTIEQSEITAEAFAVSNNGDYAGTAITVTDSTLTSQAAAAIYHAGYGSLTVEGASQIKGTAGIEMRAGSLVVESGYIEATGDFVSGPHGGGSTTDGAAIAIVQHTTQLPISVELNGGKYVGDYAVYENNQQDNPAEAVDKISLSITGGTFEGDVESQNLTGFIAGGQFAFRPAEDYMDPDYVAELQNGYYVPVESSALRAAQANAQADVRAYLATFGMTWKNVQTLADGGNEDAAALEAAYEAIAGTTSEKGVADARLAAMDAVDELVASQAEAWEQAKAAKIAELETWRDENAAGVVIPLYIYTAMNNAADEAELESYFTWAQAELKDIFTYRNQITAQASDLSDLKQMLTDLSSALTGENNSFDELLKNVEEAIAKAQSAIVGTDADSDSLAGIRDYLENTINTALEGIDDAINGADGLAAQLNGISDTLNGFTEQLEEITDALAEDSGWIADAIAAAQGDITAILGELDSLATGADISEISDELASILEDIAAVQGTVDEIAVNVSTATEVSNAKEQALTDIETWLNSYLDSIIGGTDEANSGTLIALAFTAETTDGDIYAKLTQVFSEDNAQLVLRYYNEALASIDAATTVSEVTTAVSTFKAQVASVEAAAQNTTNLTGMYVLLAVVLVAVVVVLVVVLLKKNRPAAEAAQPAQAVAQPAEQAEEPAVAEEVAQEEPAEESAEEPAAEENELAAELDGDKEQVIIAANVRSFSEAYVELDEELLSLFNKVKEYALAKEGATEVKQSSGVCIKRSGKQIVKLTVRRGYPVALFLLENEMLKDFRRTTNTNAKLKIRATELVLREEADLEAAYTMVDLSVEQIDKDIENAKERRREARRARRRQKQLEEEAQRAQEIAADAAEPEVAEEIPSENAEENGDRS